MASPSILRIERLNYGIGAVVALASLLTQSKPIALGITVGVALTCANFYVLRKLITKWTGAAAQGQSSNAPLLMLPKMVGLMLAVAAAVLFLPIDVVAFTVGYSIFIISIVIDTIYSSVAAEPANGSTDNHNG